MKDDVLIIRNRHEDYVGKMISKRGYSIKSPYIYDHNIAFRWLRRMHFRIKAPRAKTWFNEEIAKCSPKTIVVFESLISWQFLNWLRRVHPKDFNAAGTS